MRRHSHSTESTPLKLRDFREKIRGEKMVSCRLCGTEYTRVLVVFESGSVAPVEDEVLTGASSGATGVVTVFGADDRAYNLLSGTFAGGDAVGEVLLSSPTGANTSGWWGTKAEVLNGSVGGANIMTLTWEGIEQKFGIKYPLSWMEQYNDVWYCRPHAAFKQKTDALKEIEVDPTDLESERGELP